MSPAAAVDRLTDLPDSIIDHIFALLDINSAARTSALSRSLKSAWTRLPVLNLDGSSCKHPSNFANFVANVLPRADLSSVRKITYSESYPAVVSTTLDSLFKLVAYALSHGTRHLAIYVWYSISIDLSRALSSRVSNDSLETLELTGVEIDSGILLSGLRALANLNLTGCTIVGCGDLFSSFPRLESLVLARCLQSGGFRSPPQCRLGFIRISGPRLVRIKVEVREGLRIEISAPKLQLFRLGGYWWKLKLCGLSAPSLNHADIRLLRRMTAWAPEEQRMLISLFRGLHNASSLKLASHAVQVLGDILEVMELQHSPFTRLESLIVEADHVPSKLVNYLFKGSSCVNRTVKLV